MANERWESPFEWSIPYFLFIKHFTELNSIYWSHVPAASTIEKKSLETLGSNDADPKKYFLIRDEDDRRMAPTYNEWKNHYREFSNYTRLNILMLLSSCFETYLRTIISLAIESKPGCIIGCPDAIDGVFLLKTREGYGDINGSNYQFSNVIESICKGEWNNRALNYHKYFGSCPISSNDITELDQLRQKRNQVGHHFGRTKQQYETPLSLTPEPAQRLSHDRLLKYFALVYRTVRKIDNHLHRNFVGSYDICKYFIQCLQDGRITSEFSGQQAKEFGKIIGSEGLRASSEYYRNIVSYIGLNDKDDACRYGKKACISAIVRKLTENNITLIRDGHPTHFCEYHFNLFCKAFSMRGNEEFCVQKIRKQPEYFYSTKTIDLIVEKITEKPDTIIIELKEILRKRDGQPK